MRDHIVCLALVPRWPPRRSGRAGSKLIKPWSPAVMPAPRIVETLVGMLGEGDASEQALVVDNGKIIRTRGDLLDRVMDLAAKLASLGVGRGSRVAIALPDSDLLLESILAVTTLGAAAAPLNHNYTEHEFALYLSDLRPQFLLVPSESLVAARKAASNATDVDVVDLSDGGDRLDVSVQGRSAAPLATFELATSDDIALLLHTSGTTSKPKQVPLRHRNLLWSIRTIAEHYAFTAKDVSYCLMPLFHVHGLVASAWAAIWAGGSVIVPRRSTPRLFWSSITRASWTSASPTILQMVLDHPAADPASCNLRFVRSCSAALPDALAMRIEALLETPVLEAYGMTEASHQIASNPLPPMERQLGTVGKPTGTSIRIANQEWGDVASGITGRVLIQGPGVTSGYLDDPKANDEAFQDGWFDTGDLGLVDADDNVRLVGRAKELINRGGENVSPYEVEAVLLAHDAVADAVCFGVPDAKFGEQVAAAVVLRGAITERELVTFCSDRLARFKVPRQIRILGTIPRTATGKLQRRKMAEALGIRV